MFRFLFVAAIVFSSAVAAPPLSGARGYPNVSGTIGPTLGTGALIRLSALDSAINSITNDSGFSVGFVKSTARDSAQVAVTGNRYAAYFTTLRTDGDVGVGRAAVAISGYRTWVMDGTVGSLSDWYANGTDQFRVGTDTAASYIQGLTNKDVVMFRNNSEKIRLVSAGATITGTAKITSLSGTGTRTVVASSDGTLSAP